MRRDSGELNPNQDRHNHCQRIEFDCPGQDEWLQNMVLQLLICHKEDGDHDECWDGVKAAAVTATIAPRVAPMSGMRSAIPTNMAIRPAKGTPMIWGRIGQPAADDANQ